MAYAVCIQNKGYSASLEKKKIYSVKSDAIAEKKGLLRVIDESGEDYLYPEKFFYLLPATKELEKFLKRAG
ncbi:MAG: hypothetical protein HQM15_09530 [Deltaproteobacteria bacterium]|nr:hypothetical protein [Deltaproteobacteria bacterium]